MKQFILKEEPDGEGLVRLSGDDYHYLVRVRRLRAGGVFPALCGGAACEVEVLSTEGGVLRGRVRTAVSDGLSGALSPPALPPLVLFQALPKGRKIDLVVRQAAESAVSEVLVFVSEHSAASPESAAGRARRWDRIVKEARQQSGSKVETRVCFLSSLEAALSRWKELSAMPVVMPPGQPAAGQAAGPAGEFSETAPEMAGKAAALLLCEPSACLPVEDGASLEASAGMSLPPHRAAAPLEQGTFHGYLDSNPALAAVAVGPEGGFSAVETGRFLEAGFKIVRMGETVLRVETAALYGIAAVRIILLERAMWTRKK